MELVTTLNYGIKNSYSSDKNQDNYLVRMIPKRNIIVEKWLTYVNNFFNVEVCKPHDAGPGEKYSEQD